jgi:hypothetical protein
MTRKATDIFCLREVFGVQFSVFSRSDAEGEMLIQKKKKGILQEETEIRGEKAKDFEQKETKITKEGGYWGMAK